MSSEDKERANIIQNILANGDLDINQLKREGEEIYKQMERENKNFELEFIKPLTPIETFSKIYEKLLSWMENENENETQRQLNYQIDQNKFANEDENSYEREKNKIFDDLYTKNLKNIENYLNILSKEGFSRALLRQDNQEINRIEMVLESMINGIDTQNEFSFSSQEMLSFLDVSKEIFKEYQDVESDFRKNLCQNNDNLQSEVVKRFKEKFWVEFLNQQHDKKKINKKNPTWQSDS
jgi:hypothetical protein